MDKSIGLAVYGYLLVAALHSALVCRLLPAAVKREQRNAASLVYLGAIGLTACWGWLGCAAEYTGHDTLATFATFADIFRYAAWFVFALLPLRTEIYRGENRETAIVALAAFVIVGAGLIVLTLVATDRIHAAQAMRWMRLIWLALPVAGLILIEQLLRNVSEDFRWKLKPLCLALACIFVFDLFVYSQAIVIGKRLPEALSVRGGIHALAVPLLLLAATRGSGWKSPLRFSRTAAFHSTALLLTGAYLLFIAGIGYYVKYFGGDWGAALQIAFFCAGLVVLVILISSGSMQAKLRVFVSRHFFRYRYDYREEWLKFTSMLSAKGAPQEIGITIVRGLANMVESPGAMLWSRGVGESEFLQMTHWNLPRMPHERIPAAGLTEFLLERARAVDLTEYTRSLRPSETSAFPAWLNGNENLWLVVPLIVAEELIGFVVLARARTTVEVDWEVSELLATASRQAAGFLSQMLATESLLEVRKFDAFNRMSAFVVHDLKNIVTQLSLMLKNAKRLHDNPEFQRDMLDTIESSLEKMRKLMLQLREGEAPVGGQSGVDLLKIVRRIESATAERGRLLEVREAAPLTTRGHEERIERVIGHVVQNALDATEPTGRVWLTLQRLSGQAQVEVGDTGRGMSAEFVRDRLFKPFNTTKSAGMGIGAYESFQYVRELGGTILVESQPGTGTVMRISLPLFEVRKTSDLQLQDSA